MRTQARVKNTLFSAMLIALFILITTTVLAQLMTAAPPKNPILALPRDANDLTQAPHVAMPGIANSERVSASGSQRRTSNSPTATPDGSVSFLPAVSYPSGGNQAFSAAVADLNGDGKPDLLVANYCASSSTCDTANATVGVLRGNGDGTFGPAVTYRSGGYNAVSLAVADVNGDGAPDLLVANQWGGIGVLLGNGNLTFQPAVSYSSGQGVYYGVCSSVTVADVNGDGKPDLVVTTWNASSVGVLLGNGDGTFQPVVNYPASGPQAAVVADVNGDGRPDIVVADGSGAGVLLGNGDGTFQPEVMYSSGGVSPTSIVAADLNGDGKQDLVVMNFDSGNVGVLLGNGDGTFQPAVNYSGPDGAGTPSVVVGDVNGDGKLDILWVTFCMDKNCNGGVGVFLGNGDGTFQPASVFLSGGYYAWSLAAADLNGDGKLDLVTANLERPGQIWKGNVGVLINHTVFSAPTTTNLVSSPNPSLVGQAITLTATVTSSKGAPPNGEIITFYNGSAVLGTATLNAGTATLITSALPAGTSTIKVSYPGDSSFAASMSAGLQQVVNPAIKSATSTTLTPSLNPSIYGQKVVFTATVTTTGPVPPTGTVVFTGTNNFGAFTIGMATVNSSGVATLTRSNLNAGPYPLTAVYKGDTNNLASTSSVLNQSVLQTTTKATITSSLNPSIVGQAVTFTAKITSPTVMPTGPVTFTLGQTTLGTAQLGGGKATFTTSSLPAGSNVVKVTYLGNSNIAKSSAVVTQVVQP